MFVAVLLILGSQSVYAYTFKSAAQKIQNHPQVMALIHEAKVLEEKGKSESSWGDPMLSVKANNFPQDSLANNRTPMTGIQYSLSQRVPITTKFSHIEDSFLSLSKAQKLTAKRQKRALVKILWEQGITKHFLKDDFKILKENLVWLANMIKISKRLYTNGKLSQQALLELQIRESELQAQISNTEFNIKEIDRQLAYLVGDLKGNLDDSSIPWALLKADLNKEISADELEKAMTENLESSKAMVKAQKLNYVPDLTLSIGYTKRSDEVDNVGDFVSAGIGFTLPLSNKKYAESHGAYANQLKMRTELQNYKARRESELKALKIQIHKMNAELAIINDKSLPFAKGSREITAKSYGLGGAGYVELLQAELKYQDLLMRKNALSGALASKQVEFLFLRGDSLHEN